MSALIQSFVVLALLVVILVSGWKILEKAGQPGWAILVPVYNLAVICRMVGRPWWWCLLMFIPVVGWVFNILVAHGLSRSFGYGTGMTLLQLFLPFVAFPILGFGTCAYRAPG